MNKKEIINLLEITGWKSYPDQFRKEATCMYKRFDTPTRCKCNDDKAGLQVCLSVSEFEHMSGKSASIELDICGELRDGSWVKLLNYGFGSDINKALAAIPSMLAAWETLNNFEA